MSLCGPKRITQKELLRSFKSLLQQTDIIWHFMIIPRDFSPNCRI